MCHKPRLWLTPATPNNAAAKAANAGLLQACPAQSGCHARSHSAPHSRTCIACCSSSCCRCCNRAKCASRSTASALRRSAAAAPRDPSSTKRCSRRLCSCTRLSATAAWLALICWLVREGLTSSNCGHTKEQHIVDAHPLAISCRGVMHMIGRHTVQDKEQPKQQVTRT